MSRRRSKSVISIKASANLRELQRNEASEFWDLLSNFGEKMSVNIDIITVKLDKRRYDTAQV